MPSSFSLHDIGYSGLRVEYVRPFPNNGEEIRSLPVPGVLCRTCAANGEEIWVVPGLICAKCRTPASDEELFTGLYHEDTAV
ncbi:hypothetical protein B0I37DRAFT_217839 [Chaetomium sp. MPI-CAGE-AT-0009]|nr:hypothetical protein B0I37DRAFT_217839 [Chaetomium sp. MPI-CAGE-AT-0009]